MDLSNIGTESGALPKTSPVISPVFVSQRKSENASDGFTLRKVASFNYLWVLFIATVLLLAVLLHLSVMASPVSLLGKPIQIDFLKTHQSFEGSSATSPTQLRVGIGMIFSLPDRDTLFKRVLEHLLIQPGGSNSISLKTGICPSDLFDHLTRNDLDLALAGAGIVAHLPASNAYELLVSPIVNGTNTFSTFLVVPASSTARDFTDLKNKVFAFTDSFSYTGFIYPNQLLRNRGFKPETFFRRTLFSQNSGNSFFLLKKNLVDGACIDGPLFADLSKIFPEMAERLRVIEEWPLMPPPAILVSRTIPPEQRVALRNSFIQMSETHAGKQLLKALCIDRFVPADLTLYEPLRKMIQQSRDVQVEQ